MNAGHAHTEEFKERAKNKESLQARLDINKRYQNFDFHEWLHRRLAVTAGEKILDVGCGTGAQSLRFLQNIGDRGTVSALDISAESIQTLIANCNNDPRIEALVADMADLKKTIKDAYTQKKYTLSHSSYAVYYSPSRTDTLSAMIESLYSFGRIAIFTPIHPHGMLELASKFSNIDPAILESLNFGPDILETFIRPRFWEVEAHYFQSEMHVTDIEDFMRFYQATTYYNADAAEDIKAYASKKITDEGAVRYAKNGFLIIGRGKR